VGGCRRDNPVSVGELLATEVIMSDKQDFIIKVGDTVPSLNAQLRDSRGPLDLTGVQQVIFRYGPLVKNTGIASREKVCTQVDLFLGKVRVDWDTADTKPAGRYRSEFIMVYAGGQKTAPSQKFTYVEFTEHVPLTTQTY